MAAVGYPDSWYASTAVDVHDHSQLAGSEKADVCVIGGGFTGLSAALNLAERGFDVVLLEAERIGFGASGRNGGMIGSGQRKDVLETEELFGYERSRMLWDFAEAAKQEIRDRVEKHSISCDLQYGHIVGIHKRSYLSWSDELADVLAERYDYPHVSALDRKAARELVDSTEFFGCSYDSQGMSLHPLNFALGLAKAAREAGVRIFERSRVTSYTRTDPAMIETDKGSVNATFVVLGCNGYLGKLERRVASRIMPINNFMVATEPLGERRARELIAERNCVHDTRFVVNYFRTSADHRLLYGGGENYRAGFPKDIAAFVRPHMLKIFPQLDDVRLEFAWGGTLSVTVNRLPHVGRLEPNLYYAQGYSGHGISTANFAGKVIAEALAGTAERFDALSDLPTLPFPGGTLLRYPGMVLGMLYYSLRDRF